MQWLYRWYYCIPESAGGDGKFHKSQCTTTEYTKVASKKTNGMQAYCVVTASNGKKINSEKISLQVKWFTIVESIKNPNQQKWLAGLGFF